MAVAGNKSLVLGFMTVNKAAGLRGGYLLTTDYGRPLEFHYTSEVRPNAPQRLLHGPDLDQYLYAEMIGKPMTDRQSKAPRIILVDRVQLLSLRTLIPAPVLLLSADDAVGTDNSAGSNPFQTICHADFSQDLAAFEKIRELVPSSLDWMEPFERISRALAEIKDPDAKLVA